MKEILPDLNLVQLKILSVTFENSLILFILGLILVYYAFVRWLICIVQRYQFIYLSSYLVLTFMLFSILFIITSMTDHLTTGFIQITLNIHLFIALIEVLSIIFKPNKN